MFPKFKDEVRENAEIVFRILTKASSPMRQNHNNLGLLSASARLRQFRCNHIDMETSAYCPDL
jgi:hypothetical protein